MKVAALAAEKKIAERIVSVDFLIIGIDFFGFTCCFDSTPKVLKPKPKKIPPIDVMKKESAADRLIKRFQQ